MKRIIVFLLLLLTPAIAFGYFTKTESTSNDAQSIVLYGSSDGGTTITPLLVNADGSVPTSGSGGAHVTNCAATTSAALQTCINNATAGDTIQLLSGDIAITNTVTINKNLSLIGWNRFTGTTLTADPALTGPVISITATVTHSILFRNVEIIGLTKGILVDATARAIDGGLRLENSWVTVSSASNVDYAIYLKDASCEIHHSKISAASSGGSAIAILAESTATAENDVNSTIWNSDIQVSSGATSAYGIVSRSTSATNVNTVYSAYSYIKATGVGDRVGVWANRSVSGTPTVYLIHSHIEGTTYDVKADASSSVIVDGSTFINNLTSGTITYSGTVVSKNITVSQYVGLQYFNRLTRPASGAPAGSVISVGGGGIGDCGTNDGTTFETCVSDGMNWKTLSK